MKKGIEAVRLKVFNETGQVRLGLGHVTGSPTDCLVICLIIISHGNDVSDLSHHSSCCVVSLHYL